MMMQTGIQLMQEQRQQLIMTPELRQALAILQYSITELNAYLQEKVTENPVLDWEDRILNKSVGTDFATLRQSGRNRTSDRESEAWWENISGQESLYEQMEAQLRFTNLNTEQKKIARFMLGNLDDRGYLNVSVDDVCKRFNIASEQVEYILKVLQQFEPAGICARNLRECLLLQLDRMGEVNPLLKKIVQHYLLRLANGRWQQVARELGCEVEELQQLVDRLRRLDPNPGLQLVHNPHDFIIPDVVIEEENGKYVISVNDQLQGTLRLNPEYEALRAQTIDQPEQVKQYLNERFQEAVWLFRSLESRRQTLMRVTEAILQKQLAFFKQGVPFLKPLTLQDVASELQLHESTVSRAIRGKYLQTPQGVILFKTLFSTGVATVDGEGASREGVKALIKRLIQDEDKYKPLSDQRLANLLSAQGMTISRRTVTKYREELAIPASTKRKRRH